MYIHGSAELFSVFFFSRSSLLTLHGYYINIGDFLILGAALCRAIQMSVAKKLTDGKTMNSGALTTIQLAVVAIGSGILTGFHHSPFTGPWKKGFSVVDGGQNQP
ncbi:hypothetical protein LSG31_19430 [Fodinisporobacter ferrooxydans]|uniref:Uncharacterized protein n=1 Tax=Fodinisporobacter ferrooxydans TaxID=2901836 RepID=A0ABY4CHM0_9BACL|nr:hypothetical protein LSG31_19430 [Alicyclobacillaceae bacterium MYW30-H2]